MGSLPELYVHGGRGEGGGREAAGKWEERREGGERQEGGEYNKFKCLLYLACM